MINIIRNPQKTTIIETAGGYIRHSSWQLYYGALTSHSSALSRNFLGRVPVPYLIEKSQTFKPVLAIFTPVFAMYVHIIYIHFVWMGLLARALHIMGNNNLGINKIMYCFVCMCVTTMC